MRQTLAAVYEDGVFRPLNRPKLSDGQHVQLIVEMASEPSPDDILALAAKVYEDLSDEQIREIEQIALDRRDFFSRAS